MLPSRQRRPGGNLAVAIRAHDLGARQRRAPRPNRGGLLCVALVILGSAARTSQAFVCPAAVHAGQRASPLAARSLVIDKVPRVAPWRRTGTSFAAPAPRASGRSTTMLAFPSAAISSVVSPQVAVASVRAVAELLSCCVLGVVAAKRGILNPVNVGALSKIVYGIFLPSLLMVNVAKTCVSQPVASLLPIPVFAAVQIGVGMLVTSASMRLLGIDPQTEMGRETKVCGTFQNSGILPLIFLNAMFRGNPEMLTRGVAYVSFYLMGWSPSFWTIGNKILTGHMDEKKEKSPPGAISAQKPKLGLAERAKKLPSTVQRIAGGSIAKRIFSPPIMGCIAGLTIGLSPSLRWLLMRPGAPLGPVWSAFSNLTAAYTPSGVLVLAGSLANCPPGKWFTKDSGKTIAAVGMSRWLLLPTVTSGLLYTGVKYGLVPRDPMLLFVLLMESAMPSAQNSVIMLQVAGMQDSAGRCARMLCTIYLVSIIPVSVLLTVFLSALKLV